MRSFPSRLAWVLVVCLPWSVGVSLPAGRAQAPKSDPAPKGPQFKAGFAERDISPSIGQEQPGGYGKVFHSAFHDACKARAAVFDDGKKVIALVGLDALGIDRRSTLRVRKRIFEATQIPENAVLIGASHSHSSGPVGMVMPGDYDHANAFVQDLAYKQSSSADLKYLEKMETGIVEAVVEAHQKRIAAQAGISKGIEDKVAFNRRFFMKNGMTMTHPGQNNPDIIAPAGPVDPEVGVIGAWSPDGKFLGCVVNFACHATTNPGNGISANYVYYLEKVIQGYYGKDKPVVFLNGNSGDVTQVDNRSPIVHRKPEPWAEFVGGRIGAEALKQLLTMDKGARVPVDFRDSVVAMKKRLPSKARLEKATAILKSENGKADPTAWAFAKETVMLDSLIEKFPTSDVEVQTVQVGPAIFITNPAEFFCAFGLELKEKSGFPFTFPVSLANGCVGYVPTKDSFGPRGGGYETRLTSYSNLELGSGEEMVRIGLDLASQLKPGKVPTFAPAPPFKGLPWSYGSVPPEKD